MVLPGLSLRLVGTTLIEVIVGLMLFLMLLILWQPLVGLIRRSAWPDDTVLAMITAESEMARLSREGIVTINVQENDDYRVVTADGKSYYINFYKETPGLEPGMLRVRTAASGSSGGHMPLVLQVKAVSWRLLDPTRTHLTVTSYHAGIFDGIWQHKPGSDDDAPKR